MLKHRFISVALIAAALLLVTLGVANADLKTTNVLRSWDDSTGKYENGNITMHLDGTPQPFYTQLAFDNDPHADACGVGTSTAWGGDTFVGLYHADNSPAGALGFQSTSSWKLVKCSAFDNAAVKFPAAGDVLATCQESGSPAPGAACVLRGTKDTTVACTTGNCEDEIQTLFHVTTDTDCDGNQDAQFNVSGGVCLYWGAEKPPASGPLWGGNIQVRYRADNDTSGGDKTINFNQLLGPTAVNVSSLAAAVEADGSTLAAWAGAPLLAVTALFVWRRGA